MIDVKNYEGHTEGPWKATNEWFVDDDTSWGVTLSEKKLEDGRENRIGYHVLHKSDAQLIADAPKLLAKSKSLAGQLVATRAYLNDLVTFIKEQDLLEFCSKCDAFYTFDDGRQCNCCPSCVGEDYDADDNRTCRDCKIEFSERFYE